MATAAPYLSSRFAVKRPIGPPIVLCPRADSVKTQINSREIPRAAQTSSESNTGERMETYQVPLGGETAESDGHGRNRKAVGGGRWTVETESARAVLFSA